MKKNNIYQLQFSLNASFDNKIWMCCHIYNTVMDNFIDELILKYSK